MDDLRDWIRLTKTEASARRLNLLLDAFGSPGALFAASAREIADRTGCSLKAAERILEPEFAATDRELRLMERLDVRLLTIGSPDYPPLLKEIPDPPPALYLRGTLLPRDRRAVAIVGSRRVTDYGLRTATRLAQGLADAGVTVVSGLALGIDTAAHQGALRAGGRTLACLGCGVDVAYPYRNRKLADAIAESGAILSEYPMTAPPDAWHFPSRNRIISGLSLGVVVVEAPEKSGALITVECASDQNREVFAVPGSIECEGARGPHALIREGAKLVERVEDILEELNLDGDQPRLSLEMAETPPPVLTPDEERLYRLLTPEPQPIDDLIVEAGMPAGQVNSLLLLLEMKGIVRRRPGNAFQRIP